MVFILSVDRAGVGVAHERDCRIIDAVWISDELPALLSESGTELVPAAVARTNAPPTLENRGKLGVFKPKRSGFEQSFNLHSTTGQTQERFRFANCITVSRL
jgi:hypothetical protein